jgi:hypothetical protein
MAVYESTIADLIKSAVRDAQDLVRGEIALAKAEARNEARRFGTGAAVLGGAAVCALVTLGLLLTTVALGISEGFGWPLWAGFGIVTILMVIVTGVMALVGRSRFGRERHMPLTVDTLKENMKWMQARTS